MIPDDTLRRMVTQINAQDELYGCMVGYEGNNQSKVLQEGFTPSLNYGRVLVIVEEAPPGAPQQVVVSAKSPAPPTITPAPSTAAAPPAYVANQSKLWPELVGATLSCTFTVVSGVEVVGGALGEVPSAGTSTVLVVAGWVGLTASAAQCGNGLVRTFQAAVHPSDNSLQRWDDNDYYHWSFLIVDGIGILSSLPSLALSTRNLLKVLQRRGGLVAAEDLINMDRYQRQARVLDALKRATRTPEDREAVEAALREAGLTDKEIARASKRGLGSIANAMTVNEVISQQTARALSDSIKGVLMGLAPVATSALPPSIAGSASGAAYAVIIHLIGAQ
jgi:hypothetical protein